MRELRKVHNALDNSVVIDTELRALIPPLTVDERAQLEANIVADGCREALAVWERDVAPHALFERGLVAECKNPGCPYERDVAPPEEWGVGDGRYLCPGCKDWGVAPFEFDYVILDGHNRHDICTKHGIPFDTFIIDGIETFDEACDWMDANQLGRRNLTPDQASLLRGRRYNRAKRQGARTDLTSAHNEQKSDAATRLAEQHGVSRATMVRDGQFATSVERVKALDPDIEKRVALGGTDAPAKAAVVKAAKLLESAPEKAEAIIRGEIKVSDAVREQKREEIKQRLEDVANVEAKAVAGVFDVVVIDPPWPMQKIERDVRPNQSEFDYPTMTEADLADLSIPAADDCHVWLWTTHKFLPMAFRMLDKWGLKYVCTFVWHKPGGFQPIGLPQYNCEFVLYARRGSPQFIDTKAFPTAFSAPRGAHSEKPEAFYDTVRRVTAGRRLDMFNRRAIEGFDSWGKEAAA